jgi:ABC-type transport system involved in Fe-S cluster assembly fused permease/ATPase subunit
MKNLFGFIAYKLAKKKDEILEALTFVGHGVFMFVPSVVLLCAPLLLDASLLICLACAVLALVWFAVTTVVLWHGSEIVEKVRGFFVEYRAWKNKQEKVKEP